MGGNGGQMMPGICTQEGVLRIFYRPYKNPKSSAGFVPANLGIRGQHATSAPPKPLGCGTNSFSH
jgi:hypothetical protein